MNLPQMAERILDAEERFEGFENLMPFKVHNILLVSSLYDSFILREDGRLNELLIDESLELSPQQIPGITHVSSCAEALALARSQPQFNLIVTNFAVGDMNAAQLAAEVRSAGLDVPVVVLAYDYREVKNFIARNPITHIERIFLWQGNARILIAIVKYIEDKRNVLHATQALGAPDVPVVLQTSRTEFRPRAHAEGYSFLRKRSPTLLRDLRRILTEQLGFGDFVFRMPDQTEVGRASDLNTLEEQLQSVPAESIAFHAQRNHFSHWLMARTEFALAAKLRPRKVSDFRTIEHLRQNLIESINEYRREQSDVLIGDFKADTFKPSESNFLRIGSGSLGGKARGLAFVRHLLRTRRITRRFPGVRIAVPPAVVLATDMFDQFLAENNLQDFALHCDDDSEIQQRFLDCPLPVPLQDDLKVFLEEVKYPLAVRSSSLLEDSQYQPFTGVYETFMLGNERADIKVRLDELSEPIKRIYASTFSTHAKAYVRATPFRLEEEKMAVILQQVVGSMHGQRFYPDFSGVVRSHNFYPVPPMTFADGIAAVALGLGRTVVDGGTCLMFCPRYPKNLLQFSSVEDILANSQSEFWALAVHGGQHGGSSELREVRFGLEMAEEDGTLQSV